MAMQTQWVVLGGHLPVISGSDQFESIRQQSTRRPLSVTFDSTWAATPQVSLESNRSRTLHAKTSAVRAFAMNEKFGLRIP